MNKKTMGIIAILLIIFAIILIAITPTNNTDDGLKLPDGWESMGNDTYHQIDEATGGGNGRILMIQEWSKSLKKEYCENSTDYEVFNNHGDNILDYDDLGNGNYGSFEVVEINNTKYMVLVSVNIDSEASGSAHDVITEVNSLNDFKPISVL